MLRGGARPLRWRTVLISWSSDEVDRNLHLQNGLNNTLKGSSCSYVHTLGVPPSWYTVVSTWSTQWRLSFLSQESTKQWTVSFEVNWTTPKNPMTNLEPPPADDSVASSLHSNCYARFFDRMNVAAPQQTSKSSSTRHNLLRLLADLRCIACRNMEHGTWNFHARNT